MIFSGDNYIIYYTGKVQSAPIKGHNNITQNGRFIMTSLMVRNNNRFFEDFDRFFNSLFPDFPLTNFDRNWPVSPVSRAYVNENGDWKVQIAVTGFKKEEINIGIEDNVITISAKHDENEKEEDKEWKCTYKRLKTSSFEESFVVPSRLAAEKLEATYENGMLTLIIPMREEAKKKQIAIK